MDDAMGAPRRFDWHNLPSLLKYYVQAAYIRYKKAPIIAKVAVWVFICLEVVVGIALVTIGPKAMAQKSYDVAQSVRGLRYGWLLLVAVITITSFPPLVGWSTTITLCGFAYGLEGWYVASLGALCGAASTFVILRLLYRERIRAWSQQNQKWTALENVIRARGLPLIVLIRLSPFPPWVYSNLLFASIDTVSFSQFMIATCVYTARLFVGVWIGSRLAMFSDGTQREMMDTKTKIVNGLSIVIGIALAFAAGWITWKLTEQEIRKTTGGQAGQDNLAAEALESAVDDLQEPLIGSLSDEHYRDSLDESSNNELEREQVSPPQVVKSSKLRV